MEKELEHLLERPMYYRPDGTPYEGPEPHLQWAADFEKHRQIKVTRLWWGGRVSTIWLGLDHGFGQRVPLIFESMAFGWRPVNVFAELPMRLFGSDTVRRWWNEYVEWRRKRNVHIPPGSLSYLRFLSHPDLEQRRYSTKEEALAGHEEMVRYWRFPLPWRKHD